MGNKLLAVFAHPDDEVFGPGGTLAKYGHTGTEIHLLCATRGEGGQWDESAKKDNPAKIHQVREKELLNSAEILKISRVEFLDFTDGMLSNSNYHRLADKITAKIKEFRPQVVVTTERRGISGHLDHIAVSMVTTYSFLKTGEAKRLYYHCLSKSQRREESDNYFVYFPEGYDENEITTKIDYSHYFDIKKKAMFAHKSQMHDVLAILKSIEHQEKTDNFILQVNRAGKTGSGENDLFTGL